jgi:tetratricopeptide (TPR) repeat protein
MNYQPNAASRPDRRVFLIALALAGAVLAAYGPAYDGGFVNYDDQRYVTQNPHVQSGLTPDGLRWALTATEASNWHPLTWLSLQLDATIYGPDRPGGFHLTSVLLHAANTVLLFGVLWRMTGAVWPAALVAALFGLHPLHVESVAWVAERKDVLSTFFGLLALGAYIRYAERPAPGRFLGVAACFALSLMAKPMLVTLPVLLCLLDYWPLRRLPRADWLPAVPARTNAAERFATGPVTVQRWLGEKVTLSVLSVASGVATLVAQERGQALKSLARVPLESRVENALVSYVAYLVKMLWPADLACFYPYPAPGTLPWLALGAAVLLAGVTALVLRARRRPYLAVGWLWYLTALVPVIGLVQVGDQAMADRYTYVPLVGVFLMGSWALADAVACARLPRAVAGWGVAAVLAGCAAATWVQAGYWHDSPALWEHAIQATDGNYLAHYNLGLTRAQQGQVAEAARHYAQAVRFNPRYGEAHNNLGVALLAMGRPPEALQEFQRAVEADPANATAWCNLGDALARQNRPEANHAYEEALRLRPDFAKAHNNLGWLLARQGDTDAAAAHYREALRINPDYVEAHNNLGAALAQQRDWQGAVTQFAEAVRLRPDSANAHDNLGQALQDAGAGARALTHFREAVRLQPGAGKYHYDLAHALREQGQTQAAQAAYEQARRLLPGWPEEARRAAWVAATCPDARARNGTLALRVALEAYEATGGREPAFLDTLAAAYAEAGRFDKAVETAQQALALARQERPELAGPVEGRLRLYEARKPFREAAPASPPPGHAG